MADSGNFRHGDVLLLGVSPRQCRHVSEPGATKAFLIAELLWKIHMMATQSEIPGGAQVADSGNFRHGDVLLLGVSPPLMSTCFLARGN